MSDLLVGNTFGAVKTAAPKAIGEAFARAIQVQSANVDVFGQMEGPEGSGRPFCIKTDLSKGAGQVVNFTTMAALGGRGRLGEQPLAGNEEKPRIGTYPCKVEIIRHAVGWTEKLRAFMAAGQSLEGVYAMLLSDWFGRKKQHDMMINLRNAASLRNTYKINGKAFDALLSTDCLGTGIITGAKSQLITLGAKSANLSKKKSRAGSEIKQYLLFGSNIALNSLKSNSSYLTAAEYAQERGDDNVIFAGGYTNWDGNGIFEFNVTDPDGDGPVGAPILPRALLGTAVTAGTATFNITGGGVTSPLASMYPFDWFLGYDYQYFEDQVAAPDSNTYYVVILNVTGADAGKFGVYSYVGSGNDGNKLTVAARLGSASSGIRTTTLAGQTWSSTVHTDAHPTGSLIFQVNAKCTTVGWAYMFGAMAAVRAYGNVEGSGKSLQEVREQGDYGMKKGRGMVTCYGQAPAVDTQNQARNYVLIPTAVAHPEAPTSLYITS